MERQNSNVVVLSYITSKDELHFMFLFFMFIGYLLRVVQSLHGYRFVILFFIRLRYIPSSPTVFRAFLMKRMLGIC